MTPVIDRSSDLQAFELSYWPLLPSSLTVNQCFEYGGRSCLPLRDSSGFAPDSLFGLTIQANRRRMEITTGIQMVSITLF